LDDYAGYWDDLESIAEGSIAELAKMEQKFATVRNKYGLDTTTRDGNVNVKTAVNLFEKAAAIYKTDAESISNKWKGDAIIKDFVNNIMKLKSEAVTQLRDSFGENIEKEEQEKAGVIDKVDGSIDANHASAFEKQSD